MAFDQINLFEASYEKPTLPKHIRLIEFFAGIGAQAKALEILNADFEHWRTCEWSWQSITAYNAIHMGGKVEDTSNLTYEDILSKIDGVSHDYNQPMTEKQLRGKGERWARDLLGRMLANHNFCPDVSKLHAKDLGITDQANNTYVLTYSFPCQDLSNAGLLKGMEKGSGTRSGLLWEVERILLECKASNSLPQVLLMENVPAVCGANNIDPWNEWLDALHKMGYTNYWRILNAKDYGIPQNRRRCFMVSILGQVSYTFPKKQKLRYLLKDFIDQNVPEEYFLKEDTVKMFRAHSDKQQAKGNGFKFEPTDGNGVAGTITTREGQRTDDNFLIIPSATEKGYMEAHAGDGVLPTWKGARGTVQPGMIPTILTSPDTIGVVVDSNDEEALRFKTSAGDTVSATDGDCVSITFGLSESGCHTPVMKDTAKTITTMCDHDIGVVVSDPEDGE